MDPTELAAECATCGAKSPFVDRVEVRDGKRHTVHRCPSCDVEFTSWRPRFDAFMQFWDFERRAFVGLPQRGQPATPAPLPAYSPDPRRPRVRTPQDLERVLGPGAATLLQLRLEGPQVTTEMISRVAARGDLRELKALTLSGLAGGDAALTALGGGRVLRTLRLLSIIRCGATAAGLAALARAPLPLQLTSLTFQDDERAGGQPNALDDAALRALADASCLPQLEDLDVSYNPVTDAGITALQASRQLPSLRRVTAWRSGLTAERVQTLGPLRFTLHSDFDARTISYSEP